MAKKRTLSGFKILVGVAGIISAIFAVLTFLSPLKSAPTFVQSVVLTINQFFDGNGSSAGEGPKTQEPTPAFVRMSAFSQDRSLSLFIATPARIADTAGRRISMILRVTAENDAKLLLLERAGLTAKGWSVSTDNGNACDLHYGDIRGINIYTPPQVPDRFNELQKLGPGDRMNISIAAVCPARLHPGDHLLISAAIFGFPAGTRAGTGQPSVYNFSGQVALSQ